MSDWQTMHSAPTDGTLVDLWVRGEKKDLIPLAGRFHHVGNLYEGRATDCFMGGDQQWWQARGGFAALVGGTPIAWRERPASPTWMATNG